MMVKGVILPENSRGLDMGVKHMLPKGSSLAEYMTRGIALQEYGIIT